MIHKQPIVDFTEFDLDHLVATRQDVEAVNPHRFEMSLIDGVVFEDNISGRCVGFGDVKGSAFWTRGHFPEVAIMPGVLICELAAQLCGYFALKNRTLDSNLIGLSGLEDVRFRLPVRPGKRLVMMIERLKSRPILTKVRFQGFVDRELTAEGILTGIVLPDNIMRPSSDC